MAASIVALRHHENVKQDLSRISVIYKDLGANAADQVVARALGEMAHTMKLVTEMVSEEQLEKAPRHFKRLKLLAENLGMTSLAVAAEAVRDCLEKHDMVAFSAAWARLLRIGEASLISNEDEADQPIH